MVTSCKLTVKLMLRCKLPVKILWHNISPTFKIEPSQKTRTLSPWSETHTKHQSLIKIISIIQLTIQEKQYLCVWMCNKCWSRPEQTRTEQNRTEQNRTDRCPCAGRRVTCFKTSEMMWLVGSESFLGSVLTSSRSRSRNTGRKSRGSRTHRDSGFCASRVHSRSETWKSFKRLDSILFFGRGIAHGYSDDSWMRVYGGKQDRIGGKRHVS